MFHFFYFYGDLLMIIGKVLPFVHFIECSELNKKEKNFAIYSYVVELFSFFVSVLFLVFGFNILSVVFVALSLILHSVTLTYSRAFWKSLEPKIFKNDVTQFIGSHMWGIDITVKTAVYISLFTLSMPTLLISTIFYIPIFICSFLLWNNYVHC